MRFILLVLALILFSTPAYALNIGVASNINSAGDSQQSAADLLGDTNSNWTRMEIPYDLNYDFSLLDSATSKAKDKGAKILLLFSHKSGLTESEFESWIDTVVSRYKDSVDAYEIFNEIDNTLSASAYKPFLEKAYNKIKAIDNSATVVASGLTGRKEAITYWNALYDAGGGSFFDVLGIHPYRTSSPETKEFNNGSMVDSINQAVASINSHGGNKKIWITEFGWESGSVGAQTQGNLQARGFLLAASVAEVDNIISYQLYDQTGGQTFGIADSNFGKKSSFDTVATVISKIKSLTFKERIDAVSKKTIDNFDGVSGWKDVGSSGGSVGLSAATGRSGGGMKYSWNFSGSTSYVIAEKQVVLEGEPSGLALWINGDNQASVWKLRTKDANGETFQYDLGQAPSGWKQYTFDFGKDKAKTSWGGDGKIDYPIKFDSIVLDNQGGSTSGSVTIDDVEAWYGDTDLYAMRYGSSLLAYWKSTGSATATVCGQSLTFETYPKYTTSSSCDGSSSSTPTSSAPAVSTTTTETNEAAPSVKLDIGKTKVTYDRSTAKVGEKMILSVFLKDTADAVFKTSKLAVEVSGEGNSVGTPVFKDDHYEVEISSTVAGEKVVMVKVGKTVVNTHKITFEPLPVTVVEPVVAPQAEELAQTVEPTPEPKKFPIVPVATGGAAATGVSVFVAWKLGWLRVLPGLVWRRKQDSN